LCIAAAIQRLRSATRRDKVEPGALADFTARWLVRRNAIAEASPSRLSHTVSKPNRPWPYRAYARAATAARSRNEAAC
jgi:hypothetical protein